MSTETITYPRRTESITEGRWRIDPKRSSVEFHTPTLWGLATVDGQFTRYTGSLWLDRRPAIVLTIDADSLTTNNKLRDRHLRTGDFFDAANHPQVRFESDDVRVTDGRLKVRGRLYAAGESLPLDLDATVKQVAADELELEASTQADHRELGMSHGLLGMIPTPSALTVHARLIR